MTIGKYYDFRFVSYRSEWDHEPREADRYDEYHSLDGAKDAALNSNGLTPFVHDTELRIWWKWEPGQGWFEIDQKTLAAKQTRISELEVALSKLLEASLAVASYFKIDVAAEMVRDPRSPFALAINALAAGTRSAETPSAQSEGCQSGPKGNAQTHPSRSSHDPRD